VREHRLFEARQGPVDSSQAVDVLVPEPRQEGVVAPLSDEVLPVGGRLPAEAPAL
jgi:hypothetical protein